MIEFDPLEQFAKWFINESPRFGLIPFHNAVHNIQDVISVIWYRKKPFQVQMFIVPPNYVIPEHTHPNVDSYEFYLGGQINFSLNGTWTTEKFENLEPDAFGCAPFKGHVIRVHPSSLHGGTFGPAGGVFMSIQHWLNDVDPHCVSLDYDGVVVGPDHLKKVKFGKPVLKENLSEADAASKEKPQK